MSAPSPRGRAGRLPQTLPSPLPGLPPVLGIAAWSGAGKTTLLKQVLPLLRARGLRVGLVKHAHHSFDVDVPGKDSWELRKAGATPVLVASRHRWALMTETPEGEEPRLPELLALLAPLGLDLVLVEGFKHEPFPKIELHRPELGQPLLHPGDPNVLALALGGEPAADVSLPVLDPGRPEDVADFILEYAQAVARAARGSRDEEE